MLEQASQLLIKIGVYKRTHSLRGLLEDAYIASRYLARRYSNEVAEVMKSVDKLFEVLL